MGIRIRAYPWRSKVSADPASKFLKFVETITQRVLPRLIWPSDHVQLRSTTSAFLRRGKGDSNDQRTESRALPVPA